MNSLTAKRIEMLKEVKEFGVAYNASFPATSLGKQLFDSIPSSYLRRIHLDGSVSNKIDTRFVEVKEKQNEVIITDFGVTYY